MKRKFLIPSALALAAASAALLGACKATDTAGNMSAATASSKSGAPAAAGTTEVHADGIRRVSAAQLREMVGRGGVVIYDTRSKMQYDQEHIAGALSLPQGEADARAGELPRDKTLVFYCT